MNHSMDSTDQCSYTCNQQTPRDSISLVSLENNSHKNSITYLSSHSKTHPHQNPMDNSLAHDTHLSKTQTSTQTHSHNIHKR